MIGGRKGALIGAVQACGSALTPPIQSKLAGTLRYDGLAGMKLGMESVNSRESRFQGYLC